MSGVRCPTRPNQQRRKLFDTSRVAMENRARGHCHHRQELPSTTLPFRTSSWRAWKAPERYASKPWLSQFSESSQSQAWLPPFRLFKMLESMSHRVISVSLAAIRNIVAPVGVFGFVPAPAGTRHHRKPCCSNAPPSWTPVPRQTSAHILLTPVATHSAPACFSQSQTTMPPLVRSQLRPDALSIVIA